MNPKDRRRRIFKTAKKLAAGKAARPQQPRPPVPRIVTGSDIERLLRAEQEQVASIIQDVVTLLHAGPSEASKAALRQRMGKLSPAARLTARMLTKLRIESRHGNSPRADGRPQ